jgi:nucleoside-diphosphate-sugar epimerase
MARIYITGAGGRLGRAVLSRIQDASPLVRKPGGLKNEIVTDFSNEQLRSILKDAKAVIHLAGEAFSRDRKAMREANVGLTWRVVNALPQGARIIFSSSISVYGKRLAKKPADEETKTGPDSDYARTKLEAEEVVRKHPSHVILRIGTMYGPQFEDYFLILERIRKGTMKIIGSGENRIPFVHVEDVAAVIANAVERGQGTYVVAGEPLKQKEIYEIAAKEMGIPFKERRVPGPIAMLIARGSEMLKGKSAMGREHIAVLASDRVFDCAKAKIELGFSPRPLERGVKEMVAEYRKRTAAGGPKK